MKKPKPTVTTESGMILALREHFPAPEYALLPQVRNSTGFSSTVRTADALVMGLWPSRGIYLHGIEVKVRRNDWVREKRNPAKADEIAKFCDFWWIAAGSEDIVLDGELPEDWGLLVPNASGKLRVAKSPVRRAEPVAISREFLAAVMRKTTEAAVVFTDVDAEIQKRVAAEVEIEKERVRTNHLYETRRQSEYFETLKKNVEAFEAASGIRIDRYSDYFNTEIGNAVNALLQAGKDLSIKRQFVEAERVMARFLENLREQRAALDEIWPDKPEAKEQAA